METCLDSHSRFSQDPGCKPATVEPRSTDTRLIRTPALYGQFRLSRQKAHIFSLKLTCFIRTPDNMDNGHCPESQTLIYCQPRFTDTGYLHTVYFHCHNYVIIVDIVPCSNNDRFLRVNKILLQY